jgi:dihydropteroate synthase
VILYGIVNASPDSAVAESIVDSPDSALARARSLLADGADAIDLGGQGTTERASVVDWTVEWSRVEHLVPALAGLGVPVSIDSWRPEVVARALQAGATVINAADGMQRDEMWQVASDFDVPIVLPYLHGPDPKQLGELHTDPIRAMVDFFEGRLRVAERYGMRSRCIVDPGTGFAPLNWARSDPYTYQQLVFSQVDELRRFGLPLYIALPYDPEQEPLVEIVLRQRPEFGRCHRPAAIRRIERHVAADHP